MEPDGEKKASEALMKSKASEVFRGAYVKAKVEHTALVSVEVDLETGDVASVGIHPTRDEDETPSEVTVSLRVASLLLRFCCGLWSRGDRGRSCQLGGLFGLAFFDGHCQLAAFRFDLDVIATLEAAFQHAV